MSDTKIDLTKNGPLKVSGDFTIEDEKGNLIDTINMDEVYLCRCGNSSEKPFCDGTHAICHFDSSVGMQDYSS